MASSRRRSIRPLTPPTTGLTLLFALLLIPQIHAADDAAGIEFFESRIRPTLVEQCIDCHGVKKQKGGLRLDTKEALLTGGDSGPAMVPGKPEESLLIKAVRYHEKDLQMPPPKDGKSRQISAEEIEDLAKWIQMGAPDPRHAPLREGETASEPAIDYTAARRQWQYRRPQRPPVPDIRDARGWARSLIDRFLLAKLEEQQLEPAPPADKRTLLRRATFDLTGLPPTPDDVNAFITDDSPDAFAKVIDRLLSSPRYGERWARHWLDVVRYTDSSDARNLNGDGRKMDFTEAWRYRDWVVDAFNRDLPYNEFIRHQVAGDILAARAWDPAKLIATGAYVIGNWGGGDADKEKLITDIADDQVDLTGRAFLGITIACARCHDHKFDPISTEDYYALAGVFFSSHILPDPGPKTNGPNILRIPLLSPEEKAVREETRRRLGEITKQLSRNLTPLTKLNRDIHGKPGLLSWTLEKKDNPSLVINTSDAEVSFLTIKLPARTIAVHPAPESAITAAWRSPISGNLRISAKLWDADPNGGDGIAWEIRQGEITLGRGTMKNGGMVDIPEKEISVNAGDLLQVIVRPNREYSYDSTQLEFTVQDGGGQKWDLREALIDGAAQGHARVWWICSGEGEQLASDLPDNAKLEAESKRLTDQLAAATPEAHGLQEGGTPKSAHEGTHDVRVHVRGRYDRLGALVPRGFPRVLAGDEQPPIREGSGRLELAEWLTSEENPLTARVMVNRIWQHHFGEGIVRTPNNFGKLGTPPTHPELLDWLAVEFIRSGWSLKKLHRQILLSAAYQQSSIPHPETSRADPDNLLFGRMNRRRLESEALRDSLLSVAGRLDLTAGGPAVRDLANPRRTLYLMTVRSDRSGYQPLFDAADPTAIVEKRINSTVAPQALFLLNHPFVIHQAEALAQRMEEEAPKSDSERIRWLYELIFARPANGEELLRNLAAIERVRSEAKGNSAWTHLAHALLCTNEFLYVD